MDAVFVELPAFERYRAGYLDDGLYREFQNVLLTNPEAGAVIQGTGGLRKVRFEDKTRNKGKRGGVRIIYYWWSGHAEFLLFTIYSKGEMADLNLREKKALAEMLRREKAARRRHETQSV